MEIINFVLKNNLHGRCLSVKIWERAPVSFSKQDQYFIGMIISERGCGPGEDQEVSCGSET